jgi:uncharacterized protein (DUF1684 family)
MLVSKTSDNDELAWRANREASLRSPFGWLSVCGLHWLSEGPNVVCGVSVDVNGNCAFHDGTRLRDDKQQGGPDEIVIEEGRRKLLLIKRGARLALREKNNDCDVRLTFRCCYWYPLDAHRGCVRARLLPISSSMPSMMEYETIVGTVEEISNGGVVVFDWPVDPDSNTQQQEVHLQTMGKDMWIVFTDNASPHPRQLYAELIAENIVLLNFNRAHFLPCMFTAFATCPLPPKMNRLQISIPFGERESAHESSNL